MEPRLSWLNDELEALTSVEKELNENTGPTLLISDQLTVPVPVLNDGVSSDSAKVTRSKELPSKSVAGKLPKAPQKSGNVKRKPADSKPEVFPSLDLGTDDSVTTPNSRLKPDMAAYQSVSSSTPLASSSRSADATKNKSAEDELEFYTQSLINNMNSPPDKEMYGYCGKCNCIVEGEKTGCTAMDKIFHVDCFRCKTCDKLLHGSQFYVVEKEAFCENCYISSLEKCTVCSDVITERILRATGKPYHPACFKCVVCEKCLDGVPFTVDVANQIHCVDDFHKKFAPKCSVCYESIMPEPGQEETVRIVALDRSFHVKCYKCEKCGTKLSSEKEGKGCFPLDGHILCRDCNTAMVQELSRNIK